MKTLVKSPANRKPRPIVSLDRRFTDRTSRAAEKQEDSAFAEKIMLIKKNRFRRAKREKMLFLSIGFCVSLLLIIGAFEWKTYSNASVVSLSNIADNFENTIDIPLTQQVVPPTPKIEQAHFIVVPDEEVIEQEIEIDLDVEITEETVIQEVIVNIPATEEVEEKAEEIFTIVEQQPNPVGGMAAFYQYVGDNLKYPSLASRMNIQGRVFVQFVIEKDGSITDVEAIKGIGAGCDEEAVRVVSQAPAWEPGKQRGRPVRVRMILPIVFKLIE